MDNVLQSDTLVLPLCVSLSGLAGMPGEYVPQSVPMGMSMAPPSYPPAPTHHQMTPHPSQLRHGPQLHPYLPGHPHHHHHGHHGHHPHHHPHPAMLMHGGPSLHPGMTMTTQRPPLLAPNDPGAGGPGLDIHAQ
ncbi:unnamed protein product [Arctogadus glacialis]